MIDPQEPIEAPSTGWPKFGCLAGFVLTVAGGVLAFLGMLSMFGLKRFYPAFLQARYGNYSSSGFSLHPGGFHIETVGESVAFLCMAGGLMLAWKCWDLLTETPDDYLN